MLVDKRPNMMSESKHEYDIKCVYCVHLINIPILVVLVFVRAQQDYSIRKHAIIMLDRELTYFFSLC